jgi:hypothetical protein
MKITLWQQFSSNHSANFRIVGTFETVEQATQATERLKHIIRTITHWKVSNPSDWWEIWNNGEISSVEQQFSEQYGIEWKSILDWTPNNPEKAVEAVQLYERHIYLENIGSTWLGAHPFDDLLLKWGAKIAGWYELGNTWILTVISCTAPDEATAIKLEKDYEIQYQDEKTLDIEIAGIYSTDAVIKRDGLKLSYQLDIFDDFSRDNLRKLLDYFKQQGCTEIEYGFIEASE